MTQAGEEDFAIQTMTRVAHSVAQGILDTAREEKVDLILLGWRGLHGLLITPRFGPRVRLATL